MNPVPLKITITGVDQAADTLQAVRNALANRRPLHAILATEATNFTRDYLIKTPRHRTAEKLGAVPTGFRAKNATALQADSDDEGAMIRIPRSTGLGRAFSDLDIVPLHGKTYLAIPACARTYGKGPRDFPEGTFNFEIIKGSAGSFPAMVFAEGGGIGFFLRRKVHQKQDRMLLPSDAAYQELGRRVSVAYIANLVYHS